MSGGIVQHTNPSFCLPILASANPNRAWAREAQDAAKRLGKGKVWPQEHAVRPYQRVEIDGHKVDAFWTFEIEHPFGGVVEVVLPRFWVIVAIDLASQATIGYSIALRVKPTEEDILACIENSLTRWEPVCLDDVPTLSYAEGAGLPSGVFPQLLGALWDETAFDNDWANLAFSVTDALMDVVGCDVNPGCVYSLNQRPFIERFFGTLEEHFTHRMINTAGSSPRDPRRHHPEKNALRYHMNIHELKMAIDVTIANYHTEMRSGKGYRTPLEIMEHYLADNDNLIRALDHGDMHSLDKLGVCFKRKVRGNAKNGRRPYVEFFDARLT